MKLYYFPRSHWSRIVSLALAETGTAVEHELVDIRRNASFAPEYMRLNPRGVVPTLVDGDRVVWDGRDIARYIDERAGANLWRADDPETQSWIRRLHDFPLMLLSYSIWTLGKNGERSAEILADKIERATAYSERYPDLAAEYTRKAEFFSGFAARVYDDAHVEAAKARCREILDEMGELVARRPFVAGDDYTFADCIATSILYRLTDLPLVDHWHGDAGHGLDAYYRRLRARPSFAAVFVDDPMLAVVDAT